MSREDRIKFVCTLGSFALPQAAQAPEFTSRAAVRQRIEELLWALKADSAREEFQGVLLLLSVTALCAAADAEGEGQVL